MAEIKLTVGALTASIMATDESATRILQGALIGSGYDIGSMTAQEQADAVTIVIVNYIQELAKQTEMQQAIVDAKNEIVTLRAALADAEAFVNMAGVPIADDPPMWEDSQS